MYSSFGDDPRSVEITSALKKNHLYPIACGQAHLCELGKKLFWLRSSHPARKNADSYSVATYLLQQRNIEYIEYIEYRIYSISARWLPPLRMINKVKVKVERQFKVRASAWGGGRKSGQSLCAFLSSFPWYTSNSLNPSHQSQPIQRSDRVGVWEKWLFLHFSSILQSILLVRWRLRRLKFSPNSHKWTYSRANF